MKNIIKIILISYILIIFLAEFILPAGRYLFYILPLVVLSIAGFTQKVKLDNLNKRLLILAFVPVLSFIGLLLNNFTNPFIIRYFKEIIFLTPGIITAIYCRKYIEPYIFEKYMKIFVVALMLLFGLSEFNTVINLLTNFRLFLVSSVSDTESTYASVYGVIALYFFVNKKYKYFMISLILVLIGSKRMVLGGVLASVIVGTFINKIGFKSSTIIFFGLVTNTIVVIILTNISSYNWDFITNQYFGISSNQLLMGRLTTYEIVLNSLNNFSILGNGFGSTSVILEQAKIYGNDTFLLHSDVLKIFIETGVIFFFVYFYNLLSLIKEDRNLIYFVIYLNIIYLTGNTMIFVHVNIILYLIIITVHKNNENINRIPS